MTQPIKHIKRSVVCVFQAQQLFHRLHSKLFDHTPGYAQVSNKVCHCGKMESRCAASVQTSTSADESPAETKRQHSDPKAKWWRRRWMQLQQTSADDPHLGEWLQEPHCIRFIFQIRLLDVLLYSGRFRS